MTTNGGNQETLAAKRPVAFGDYQFEIYAAGLSGTLPSLPMVYAELDPSKESPHRRGQTSFSGVGRDLICGSESDSTAALAGTMRTVIAAVVRTAEVPPRLTGGLVSVEGGGRRAQWSDRRVRER